MLWERIQANKSAIPHSMSLLYEVHSFDKGKLRIT